VNHFDYRDGVLHAEDVAIPDIAAQVGTPFYCYSTATLTRHYRVFAQAFAGLDALVCYAMKANSNQAVLRTLARLGAGADVVSEGELRRALAAGIPASKILFSTDASLVPELYWVGARLGRRALGRVLDEHIDDGAIDERTALDWAERILWRNSEAVYGL